MSVLVDTSAWVDFVNGHDSPEAARLAEFIERGVPLATCGLVAAEFLQGLVRERDLRQLERLFLDLEWLTPREPDTWLAAAALYRRLRRSGVTVRSTVDCVVARLAAEHACALLARDRDMAHILASGLVDVRSA